MKSLTLAICLALTLATQLPTRAEDAPPARQRPPGRCATPRWIWPPWRRTRLRQPLAGRKGQAQGRERENGGQDPKVQAARAKMEAAAKEMRDAMNARFGTADPSVEPILKKLEEAREKAMKEGGGRSPRRAAAEVEASHSRGLTLALRCDTS